MTIKCPRCGVGYTSPLDVLGEILLEVALLEAAEAMANHILGTAPLPEGYEPDPRGDRLGFERAQKLRRAALAYRAGTAELERRMRGKT